MPSVPRVRVFSIVSWDISHDQSNLLSSTELSLCGVNAHQMPVVYVPLYFLLEKFIEHDWSPSVLSPAVVWSTSGKCEPLVL
jgi:hypothetical protein